MVTSAGWQAEAGRIPGERIATSIETSDSSTFTTTETQVQSVTAPLVDGRTYKVVFSSGFENSAAGSLRAQLREDNTSGTVLQIRDRGMDTTGTVEGVHAEAEYTASSTANKTFVATGDVRSGGGTAKRRGGTTYPSYLYVDYISG